MATVLIVEDEWAIADWLQSLLGDEGHDVLIAGNGKRALELLETHTPDLILTDFMMPIMDGAAMLHTMRRDGRMDIPVIVMSSLPEATIKERLDGHRAFIRKPFREAELIRTIRHVLDSSGR